MQNQETHPYVAHPHTAHHDHHFFQFQTAVHHHHTLAPLATGEHTPCIASPVEATTIDLKAFPVNCRENDGGVPQFCRRNGTTMVV